MVTPEEIKALIESHLPGAKVAVNGDDGRHFEATVISVDFKDKTVIQQHRMVYEALGDKMRSAIHALTIKTYIDRG